MTTTINAVISAMLNIDKAGGDEPCPISIIDFNKWEWAQGVGVYGIYKAYKKTNNKKYLDILLQWFDKRLQEGLPEKNVNTCAPMLTLAFLYEECGNDTYLEYIKEWSAWIMNSMPRTKEGGIQHNVSGYENVGQLWADTLFMTVLFLAKAGMLLKLNNYVEESIKQFLVHIKYLHDKQTGLWFHGWSFAENTNFARALWARGNCWYTVSVVELIEITEMKDGAIKQYLLDTLSNQVEGLIKYQHTSGLWHTLIDQEDSYLEASGSAGFAFGMLKAVKNNYLDEAVMPYAQKAIDGLLTQIDEYGIVKQVSYGTAVGKTLDEYKNIPLCPMTYGQALALLALCEA